MGDKKKKDKKSKKEKKEKKEKKQDKQVLIVEYNISMHCNACERMVTKAVFKIKGVDTFVTDMPGNKVIITGKIDPHKVLKKLKKKTGKRVEIMNIEEESEDADEEQHFFTGGIWYPIIFSAPLSCCEENVYTMFSDENANACSIM